MTAGIRRVWKAPARSLCLLGDVAGRERGAVAEEEVLHVLGDEVLRFLLPRHQAVLVEDHLHALFPELPRVLRDVVVDALAEIAWPGNRVEPRQLLLELDAHDRAAALVGRGARRGGGVSAGISHGGDCSGFAP